MEFEKGDGCMFDSFPAVYSNDRLILTVMKKRSPSPCAKNTGGKGRLSLALATAYRHRLLPLVGVIGKLLLRSARLLRSGRWPLSHPFWPIQSRSVFSNTANFQGNRVNRLRLRWLSITLFHDRTNSSLTELREIRLIVLLL